LVSKSVFGNPVLAQAGGGKISLGQMEAGRRWRQTCSLAKGHCPNLPFWCGMASGRKPWKAYPIRVGNQEMVMLLCTKSHNRIILSKLFI
jgi:hypothetical protein